MDFGKEIVNNLNITKRQLKASNSSKKKKGWNHNLNIPYYRRVSKKPLMDLQHDLDNLISP